MVYLVRSEDRRPSKRVFPLLQNRDLDTVTFAQVQSTGNPISIEDMNEQEMFDLVLVNLARLVVSGEWTGLLEAGGGGLKIANSTMKDGVYDQFNTADAPPYGIYANYTEFQTATWIDEIFFFPFVAQKTGTVSSLGLTFQLAGAYELAIYDLDAEYMPNLLIVKGQLEATGAETVYQTSLTGFGGGAAGTITEGETYWMSYLRVTGKTASKVTSTKGNYRTRVCATNSPSETTGNHLRNPDYDASTGPPDTMVNTNTYPGSVTCPKATYEV